MNGNSYMINMQKLLYKVEELHIGGFEKLLVIPSVFKWLRENDLVFYSI